MTCRLCDPTSFSDLEDTLLLLPQISSLDTNILQKSETKVLKAE